MDAIILAGGDRDVTNKGNFEQSKALAQLRGIPMVKYVIEALKHSEYINQILVVGNVRQLEPIIGEEVDTLIQERADIIDNLISSIHYCEKSKYVLIATCDIPLINGQVVKKFIEDALELKADLCYPIIERSVFQGRYADIKRTYASLREGDFTGGNLFLLKPDVIEKVQQVAKSLIKHRKNPVKMAGILGVSFITRFLLKKITLQEIEKYVEERFRIKARALITQDCEIGNDIDRAEDVEIFERYL